MLKSRPNSRLSWAGLPACRRGGPPADVRIDLPAPINTATGGRVLEALGVQGRQLRGPQGQVVLQVRGDAGRVERAAAVLWWMYGTGGGVA